MVEGRRAMKLRVASLVLSVSVLYVLAVMGLNSFSKIRWTVVSRLGWSACIPIRKTMANYLVPTCKPRVYKNRILDRFIMIYFCHFCSLSSLFFNYWCHQMCITAPSPSTSCINKPSFTPIHRFQCTIIHACFPSTFILP